MELNFEGCVSQVKCHYLFKHTASCTVMTVSLLTPFTLISKKVSADFCDVVHHALVLLFCGATILHCSLDGQNYSLQVWIYF